jgi:hypothetical protein
MAATAPTSLAKFATSRSPQTCRHATEEWMGMSLWESVSGPLVRPARYVGSKRQMNNVFLTRPLVHLLVEVLVMVDLPLDARILLAL